MKLPCLLQPRILRQAFGALFSRPFTTRFPAEPSTRNVTGVAAR